MAPKLLLRNTVRESGVIRGCTFYLEGQEGDTWRIRNSEELNRCINGEDIVKFIKAQRIRCLGHVKRMEVGAMPRKMIEGRPRLRWMDDVVAYLKVMKIKQWMEKTKDGDGERLLRRPRLTQGCRAERMDGRVP
jgi:hypothetical protein